MSIITLDEYKTYAGVSNPKDDDKLQILVDYANSFISEYCNVKFSPSSISEERNTCFNGEIFLQEIPVLSVDEIRIMRGKELVGVLPAEDFHLEPQQGVVTIIDTSVQIPDSGFNVSVDYTHGYSGAPQALVLAALELVTYFNKREFNRSRNTGNGETSQFADPNVIPVHIRAPLDLYRRL